MVPLLVFLSVIAAVSYAYLVRVEETRARDALEHTAHLTKLQVDAYIAHMTEQVGRLQDVA